MLPVWVLPLCMYNIGFLCTLYRIRNQVELERHQVFPNFFCLFSRIITAFLNVCSKFLNFCSKSTSAASARATCTSTKTIGTTESLINRVQHNVSSCNPSWMRNQGVVERSRTAPYKVVYYQHSRKASVSDRSFVKDIVMVEHSDENVPHGLCSQCLHEAGLVVSFMEFNTLWKDDVVIQTIENAFKNVLNESQSHTR